MLGLRHAYNQDFFNPFNAEFLPRLKVYDKANKELNPKCTDEVKLMQKLYALEEKVKEGVKDEALAGEIAKIRESILKSEPNLDFEKVSGELSKKWEIKAIEKFQEIWTVAEIIILIRSIVLHGESGFTNRTKGLKRSIASKKAKWLTIKR